MIDELLYVTLARLVVFLVLTAAIIGGVAACGHHINYRIASLISFGVVFCGILIEDWVE